VIIVVRGASAPRDSHDVVVVAARHRRASHVETAPPGGLRTSTTTSLAA